MKKGDKKIKRAVLNIGNVKYGSVEIENQRIM